MSTESDLRDWRGGQIVAERLCAGILTISGYSDIDPQAPLGGPDGKKDILARHSGRKFVAAVYFPPTPPTFSQIRRKFEDDRVGVDRHGADGFIFLVNQPLTLSQRRDLVGIGHPLDEIYHLERLRLLLDSPHGYGLRLEFLRRPMELEEQISFFSTLQQEMTQRLLANERRIEEKIDVIFQRTRSIMLALNLDAGPSSIGADLVGDTGASMSRLDVATLQLLHRALTDGSALPHALHGQIRGVQVWIGDPDNPVFVPPPPDEVPRRLVKLLEWWQGAYALAAKNADLDAVVQVLAELHYGLVAIHPFLDANGRLARLVTDQAARELLQRGVGSELTKDHRSYFRALEAANCGDLAELVRLIKAALE